MYGNTIDLVLCQLLKTSTKHLRTELLCEGLKRDIMVLQMCLKENVRIRPSDQVQMTRCHSIVYRLEWNGDIAAKGVVSPLRSGLRLTIYCQLGVHKQNRAFENDEK